MIRQDSILEEMDLRRVERVVSPLDHRLWSREKPYYHLGSAFFTRCVWHSSDRYQLPMTAVCEARGLLADNTW